MLSSYIATVLCILKLFINLNITSQKKPLGLNHCYLDQVIFEHSKFDSLFHSLNVTECTLGCQYTRVHFTCYNYTTLEKLLFKGQGSVNLTMKPAYSGTFTEFSHKLINLSYIFSIQTKLFLKKSFTGSRKLIFQNLEESLLKLLRFSRNFR